MVATAQAQAEAIKGAQERGEHCPSRLEHPRQVRRKPAEGLSIPE
jgi:hypothetical protein